MSFAGPYTYNSGTLTWDAFGRSSLPATPAFVLGQTQPDFNGLVSGVPVAQLDDLVNYTDHLTPRTITVSIPNTVIEGYNMGNVRLRVITTGVIIRNCRWIITNNRTNEPMISFDSSSVRNALVQNVTITNTDQLGYNFNAIQGHDFLADRVTVTGTVDGIRPNLGGDWAIHGCAIGYLGWWANDATHGPSLNSGNQTHSDCIQTTYGGGEIIGCLLAGYVSETVGTGTPGNGSETTTGAWYTQAEGEARRNALLTSTNPANKSFDGVAHKVNTYITPLMCTRDTASPSALDLDVTDNWFAGGGLQINALNTNLTAPVGRFYRNRHYHDVSSGAAYRWRTDLAADVPQTGPNVNRWLDNDAVVPVSRP